MTESDAAPTADAAATADFVQSLARGLTVIRAFDGEPAELSLAEVARRADIPRAAARRFLRTLEQLGYVRATADARFLLTPRVLELGYGYLSSLSLPEIVQPHLDALSHQIGESVSVAVLDGDEIVYVARAAARRIMSVRITIGTRLPAFATSMGRVLLAALPESDAAAVLDESKLIAYTPRTRADRAAVIAEVETVREQGWAMVDGELEEGLRSIAVPLHGRRGVTAALNVSTSTVRGSADETRRDLLPALRETAVAIEQELRTSS
ncbi:IclR family transcriptional regulator C-terminal domain-containing protein [Microbacterium profundi]|uniref:IclR family transcriptional regulator C-terminal domain-containing protein n=1 Tax=Microbacterium profundi TaxID=450380 RepID=A0ABV3LH96_9MICO|nr:IclR family transcriptional regulator C-terminal domain-containing protein [Microbacterium profundi]MCE7483701.1 helix-turn-helix domain-containing protein [Microbacterium profundi]